MSTAVALDRGVVAECGWLVRLLDTWIDTPELKFPGFRKRPVMVACLEY